MANWVQIAKAEVDERKATEARQIAEIVAKENRNRAEKEKELVDRLQNDTLTFFNELEVMSAELNGEGYKANVAYEWANVSLLGFPILYLPSYTRCNELTYMLLFGSLGVSSVVFMSREFPVIIISEGRLIHTGYPNIFLEQGKTGYILQLKDLIKRYIK